MASGLPDYYRGVDIAYQALSQVIVRPKYGGARSVSGSVTVEANTGTNLLYIVGKGMIYGGVVWLDHTLTQANSVVLLITDMQSLSDLSFVRLSQYGITDPRKAVVSLNKYDSTNYIYSVGIGYGVTFESAISVSYVEEHGFMPVVHYMLTYTLI